MFRGFRRAAVAAVATVMVPMALAPGAVADEEVHGDPANVPVNIENFAITSEVPTLAELDAQIRLLVATPAPDWVKANQLEGGSRAVVVPKMIYRVGFFRPPKGSSVVTGPETHEPDRHTAVINASRQGAPTVQVEAEWRRIDGQWKLASKSLCNGIKTIGLPIPCNFE
jgi:hypothetical protein